MQIVEEIMRLSEKIMQLSEKIVRLAQRTINSHIINNKAISMDSPMGAQNLFPFLTIVIF
ncbi:hypothetical protein BIV59_04820 [Bacillus sp. MUM 13]|nr:hypothetical protein BIV59_04820 [Bacillus sp. MUM 13]